MPELGATFYPGGVDDYYMPEVVAPAPQRYVVNGLHPFLLSYPSASSSTGHILA